MRLSDLLYHRVQTAEGDYVGEVADVRLVGARTDGELVLEVDGLVVLPHRWTRLLGYDHRNLSGPWPLTWLGRRGYEKRLFVPWRLVDRHDDGVILRAGVATEDLPRAPALEHSRDER